MNSGNESAHWQLIPEDASYLVLDLIPGKELVLGRDPNADLLLLHPKISRQHATLEVMDDCVAVRDIGSRNGVKINGDYVAAGELYPGDEVCFEKVVYHLRSPFGETEQKESVPQNTTAMMPCIAVLEGVSSPYEGKVFTLAGDDLVVGRDEGCDIVLDHSSISAEHARLYLSGRQWFLSDDESTNGTLVNGSPAENTGLHNGDQLSFGGLVLYYKSLDASTADPTPKASQSLSPSNQAPQLQPELVAASAASHSPQVLNAVSHKTGPVSYKRAKVARIALAGTLLSALLVLLVLDFGRWQLLVEDLFDRYSGADTLGNEPLALSRNWPILKLPSHLSGQYPKGWTAPVLVDLNGDYLPDIVTQDKGGTLRAIDGRAGTLLFTRELPGEGRAIAALPGVEAGHVISVHGSVSLLDKTGAIAWSSRAKLGDIRFAPIVADVNADGFPDVMVPSEALGLAALDGRYGGRLLWQRGFENSASFGAAPLQIPASGQDVASFVIASDDGQVMAVDVRAGRPVVRWLQRFDPILLAAPSYSRGPRGLVIVHTHQQQLLALDVLSGAVVWQRPVATINFAPLVSANCNVDAQQDVVIASVDGSIACVDGSNGAILWQRDLGGEFQSNPALYDISGDGLVDLFQLDTGGGLTVLNGATGETLLTATINVNDRYLHSMLLAENTADGQLDLVVLSESGSLRSLSLNRSVDRGSALWPMGTGSNYHAVPVVTD